MMDSKMQYKKMTGVADTKGQMFEIKMAAMLFARGINSGLNFQLASNVVDAGKLDDIVFRFRPPGGATWHTVFVQLKHKRRSMVTLGILTAPKGDFALVNYCKSYRDIKQFMTASDPPTLFDGCIDECSFVLFTNAQVKEELGPGRCLGFDQVEKFLGSGSGSVHSFSPDGDTATDRMFLRYLSEFGDDGRDFMKKLTLFCGQAAENELNDIIIHELEIMKAATPGNNFDINRLCECFVETVGKWCSQESVILDQNSDVLRKAWDRVVVETCCARAKESFLLDVSFDDTAVSPLREVLSVEPLQVTCVECSDISTRLTCTKLVQALTGSYLLLGAEDLLLNRAAVLSECRHGHYDTVILVESPRQTNADFANLVTRLPRILASSKQLVVVTRMSGSLGVRLVRVTGANSFYDTFEFPQLEETSRQRILDSEFRLQGRYISFQTFLNSTDGNNVFRASTLVDILKSGQGLSVGAAVAAVISHYVPRTVERTTLKISLFHGSPDSMTIVHSSLNDVQSMLLKFDPSLSSQHVQRALNNNSRPPVSEHEDAVIHAGKTFQIGKYELNFLFPRNGQTNQATGLRMRPRPDASTPTPLDGWFLFVFTGTSDPDIESLSKLCDSKHVLCFEGDKIRWVQSTGGIGVIRKHIDEQRVVSFDPAAMTNASDRVVLLCAQPGMGKSTLMASMASRLKNAFPHFWVLKLSLLEHTKLFAEDKHLDALEFLVTAAGIKTPLKKSLFEFALQVTGNVVVVLDGCDEISKKYLNQCCVLLSNILETKTKKILVTSRSSTKRALEGHLSTLAVKLRKLGADDQKNFLKLVLTGIDSSIEGLDDLITRLTTSTEVSELDKEFMGFPLQLLLLSEVLKEQIPVYQDLSELEVPLLLELFLEKKFSVDQDKRKMEQAGF